jgi:hypothetical protein
MSASLMASLVSRRHVVWTTFLVLDVLTGQHLADTPLGEGGGRVELTGLAQSEQQPPDIVVFSE